MMLTKENIIDNYILTFDPGDKLNGSLYIGSQQQNDAGIDQLIAEMRKQKIWSAIEFKQVPNEHRSAYKEQLDFVEAFQYKDNASEWIIARFDHSKYPSDKHRWQEWVRFLDTYFAKA